MSFASVDKKRYEYILSLGADEDELARFFSENRAQLIIHGARVQNLPYGHSARVRTLSQLPTATEKTVANWFRENLTMADPVAPAEIVEEFALYEQEGETLEENEAKRLARSCLVHLFAAPPSPEILAFLRTPIGGVTDPAGNREPSQSSTTHAGLAENVRHASDGVDAAFVADVVVAILESRDVEKLLAACPPSLATFLQAVQVALRGNLEQARQLYRALEAEPGLAARLTSYLDGLDRLRTESAQLRRGVNVTLLSEFSGEFDLATDAVVGYCTNSERTTAVFIRPIAVVRAGSVMRLKPAEADRLFPESGDLIAFAGAGHPTQPSRGDIGVWRVGEHPTSGRTRFHIEADRRALHEVIRVPFPSGDPDSVRQFLLANSGVFNGRIYELEDGLIIAARPERPDLSKEETYDTGLRAWDALPGFRIEGRLFVVGPLPQEHLSFECASLQSTARMVLQGRKTDAGPLSKTIARDLARAISEEAGGASRQRILRVSRHLEQLAENSEMAEALAQQALALPAIKRRVEEAISSEVAGRVAQRNELSGELARLSAVRVQEEERIRKLRDEQRRLKDETTKAVRGVFDRAKSAGIAEVLAQAALFGALGSTASEAVAAPMPTLGQNNILPRWRIINAAAKACSAEEMCKKFGGSKQRGAAMSVVLQIARDSGLLFGLHGHLAGPLLLALAETGALGPKICVVDATLGLLDDDRVREILETEPSLSAMILRDANLSPIEIYARALLDRSILDIAQFRPNSIQFCFNTSGSIAALPLPEQVLRISLLVDLDQPLRPMSEFSEGDGLIEQVTPMALEASLGLMPLAADRLSVEVLKLDRESLRLACSILLAQQTNPS